MKDIVLIDHISNGKPLSQLLRFYSTTDLTVRPKQFEDLRFKIIANSVIRLRALNNENR